MKVSLLYGTETGNAEMLCEDICDQLEGASDIAIANLEDTAPGDLEADRFYMMVCSTYGDGELPNSAIPFVDALVKEKTDLSGIRFAVFGLGDTSYDETYNNGSVVLMNALTAAGAEVVGERGLHDASGIDDPIDIGLPWAQSQLEEAKKHFGG